MTTLDDAKKLAMLVFQAAKEKLTTDGQIPAVVFFVTNKSITHSCCLKTIENQEDAKAKYQHVTEMAAQALPDATITVAPAYFKLGDDMEELKRTTNMDMAAFDPAIREAVLIAIKGRAIGSTVQLVPYRKTELGDLEWFQPDEPIDCSDSKEHYINHGVGDWWDLNQPQVCDFCFDPKPITVYKTNAYGNPEHVRMLNAVFDNNEWHACEACKEMVEKRDLRGLVDRAKVAFASQFDGLPEHVAEMMLCDMFGRVLGSLEHQTRTKRAASN